MTREEYVCARLRVLSDRLRVGSIRMIGLQKMTREVAEELEAMAVEIETVKKEPTP